MIEFSGRMSRVFLKKIQLFFIFFEKTAKTPLPATMSTLYQHSAPTEAPPRAGNFFREARNFSRRRENFPCEGTFFSPGDNFFAPAEDFFMPRGRFPYVEGRPAAVLQAGRGFSRAIYAPIYALIYAVGTPHRRPSAADSSTRGMLEALPICILGGYFRDASKTK